MYLLNRKLILQYVLHGLWRLGLLKTITSIDFHSFNIINTCVNNTKNKMFKDLNFIKK